MDIRRLGIKFIREVEKSKNNLDYYLAMIGIKSQTLAEIKKESIC